MVYVTVSLAVGWLVTVGALVHLVARQADTIPIDVYRDLADTLTKAVATTSEAIGAAASTSLAPPPASRDDLVRAAASELASDPTFVDVDDRDPTDAFVLSPERDNVAFAPGDVDAPFGIPGVQFPGGL